MVPLRDKATMYISPSLLPRRWLYLRHSPPVNRKCHGAYKSRFTSGALPFPGAGNSRDSTRPRLSFLRQKASSFRNLLAKSECIKIFSWEIQTFQNIIRRKHDNFSEAYGSISIVLNSCEGFLNSIYICYYMEVIFQRSLKASDKQKI